MLGAIGQSSLPDRFFFWLSEAFRETVCRTFGAGGPVIASDSQ